MSTERKPLFIAFSSQKGGVGKSTFTTLVASVLHYRMGYNVAVMDCDYPQHSLMLQRERDLKAVMQNDTYKRLALKQFTSINKKAYPIIKCKAEEAMDKIEAFIKESPIEIDAVFFDLPGTVNTPGVLSILASSHHIFTPITADRVVLESTLSFSDILVNQIIKSGQTYIQSVRLFWNMVDGREKSPLYEMYEKAIRELGLTLMHAHISDSKRFRKEGEAMSKVVFRSTILPPDEQLMKGCGLETFIKEFLLIIKL